MIHITDETKQTLANAYPQFGQACRAFFRQELPASKYKGISGKFGSYAERGGEKGMIRLRFSGGTIARKDMDFLIHAIETYGVKLIHFTTGEAIQLHKLACEDILTLYKEAFAQGIYCMGGGGDNPRNVTASPLRGVDPKEFFDISPYVDAAASYAISLIPKLHLPRKYKIGISNGTDNEGHATFKDLGFLAKENGRFDVYAAGGLGAGNPRFGVKVGEDVDPTKILYYIDAFAQLFMDYGNYKNRAKARSRFMPAEMGDEKFARLFQEYLAKAQKKSLDIVPENQEITKQGTPGAAPANDRIHPQKQKDLYYVEYHPLGGTPNAEVFVKALQYLAGVDGAEARLNADETLYAINLTAEEAQRFAEITAPDSAANVFEKTVCCIGASICQQGLRDSHGMWLRTVAALRDKGISTDLLPQMHISGCPSSCGTHQIGAIGFRGAAKKVKGEMKPAFAVFVGGSYVPATEQLGTQVGTLTEDEIPAFLTDLSHTLEASGQPFAKWYASHAEDFADLVKKHE